MNNTPLGMAKRLRKIAEQIEIDADHNRYTVEDKSPSSVRVKISFSVRGKPDVLGNLAPEFLVYTATIPVGDHYSADLNGVIVDTLHVDVLDGAGEAQL
jgi:hypothetical protein